MRLLLDTHALVWAGVGDRRLSRRANAALNDPGNTLYVSVVSRWEIAVKQRRDASFGLALPLGDLIERHRLVPLDLSFEVPAQLKDMPDIHGDPFDRLLVAQALHHQLTLMTNDRAIKRYPVETLW